MLNGQFHKDLNWWLTYLDVCNGRQYYSDHAEEYVLTDACKVASGCFWAGDWHYSAFHVDEPLAAPMHINCKRFALSQIGGAVGPGESGVNSHGACRQRSH